MENQNHKLRLSDFIPLGIGMLRYIHRNVYRGEGNAIDQEEIVIRTGLLFYYNVTLFVAGSIPIIYKIANGLEKAVSSSPLDSF